MRDLEIDLELIEDMARRHTMAAEDLEEVLSTMPTHVDGGVASGVVAEIIGKLATHASELAVASRVMGAALADTAADSRNTDAAVADTFGAALRSLEEGR